MTRAPGSRLPLPALVLLLLAGCAADKPAQQGPINWDALKKPEAPTPAEDPRVQPHLAQMQRTEVLLTRWDGLRADGRSVEAEALKPRIAQEVDGDFVTFQRAADGELGPQAQYLAVSALGFSNRPEATRALLTRLADRDAGLVGNALIALSVRSDPDTPVDALVNLIAPTLPAAVKRYAPLALANVMDARTRAGAPVDAVREQVALAKLGAIVLDPDPVTRLHVAKALSALRIRGSLPYLRTLVGDPTMRVRWAAAAALEAQGDPEGFADVVKLLAEVAPESRTVIRDILVSYAGRIQGRPLTQAEIDSLGTGPRAWSQWFNHVRGQVPASPSAGG